MTDERDDGGPAFPQTGTASHQHDAGCGDVYTVAGKPGFPGMSLRDWYAGQIVGHMIGGATFWSTERPGEVAQDAYAVADALIAQAKAEGTAS